MKLNLLVIRTHDIELLKQQYELLGFDFVYHQHGNGPFHYASEQEGFVFEIYPLSSSVEKADDLIRLGFEVEALSSTIDQLKDSTWEIVSEVRETEWGQVAIVQDLDGRKVELKAKE